MRYQRPFVKTFFKSAIPKNSSPCQANFYQEKFAQLIEAEVDRRLEAESELRIERERQVDTIISAGPKIAVP